MRWLVQLSRNVIAWPFVRSMLRVELDDEYNGAAFASICLSVTSPFKHSLSLLLDATTQSSSQYLIAFC